LSHEEPAHADTPEARSYNRTGRWIAAADYLLSAAFLVVLLATGWTRRLRDFAYFSAGQNYLLALFYYLLTLAIVSKLLGLGLDYYGFRLERRYHLSSQGHLSWAGDELKSWLVGLVFTTIAAELVYLLMRFSPVYWWLIAWIVFVALFVLLMQLAPVLLLPLFYKFRPLDRDELRERLVRLSARAGTRVRGVFEWKLSAKSRKANAALTGLGRTRRIILADTLLDNFADDEIEAVLAHELGHHVHRHIPKSIAVQSVVSFVGFWAAARLLHYAVRVEMFDRISDFADLPLLALVSTVLSLLLLPLLNAWMRHNERQADRYAFASIASVEPFIAAMSKLADQNLAEREPARWREVLFHSHPSIARRMAAARAWAAAHGASGS
jgi:STE24 endopeptidase